MGSCCSSNNNNSSYTNSASSNNVSDTVPNNTLDTVPNTSDVVPNVSIHKNEVKNEVIDDMQFIINKFAYPFNYSTSPYPVYTTELPSQFKYINIPYPITKYNFSREQTQPFLYKRMLPFSCQQQMKFENKQQKQTSNKKMLTFSCQRQIKFSNSPTDKTISCQYQQFQSINQFNIIPSAVPDTDTLNIDQPINCTNTIYQNQQITLPLFVNIPPSPIYKNTHGI